MKPLDHLMWCELKKSREIFISAIIFSEVSSFICPDHQLVGGYSPVPKRGYNHLVNKPDHSNVAQTTNENGVSIMRITSESQPVVII